MYLQRVSVRVKQRQLLESLNALVNLVEQAGGNIVGKMAVLAEGDAADRDDILFLEKLPLFDADGNAL